MWKYIFWKTSLSVVALFIVVAVFYLSYVSVKPDPYPPFFQDKGQTDPNAANKILYHIDKSAIVRFGYWMQDVFTKGDFGVMYNMGNTLTIPQKFFKQFPESMLVSIPSYFIGLVLGVGLGVWAGYRRGFLADKIINGFVMFFVAIPSFILAVFAVIIGPLMGLPLTFEKSLGLSAMVKTIILPIIVMTLVSLASWAKLTRYEVGNILSSDYILAARTKGFSEWFIFRRYVLRNAMFPFMGSLATSFTVVFGSSLIIERYFGVGGISSLMLDAANKSEVNLLLFNMSFMLVLGLSTQIIADVAVFSSNPVMKASFKSGNSPFAKIKLAWKRHQTQPVQVGGKND